MRHSLLPGDNALLLLLLVIWLLLPVLLLWLVSPAE
jgi:hypothetical protein